MGLVFQSVKLQIRGLVLQIRGMQILVYLKWFQADFGAIKSGFSAANAAANSRESAMFQAEFGAKTYGFGAVKSGDGYSPDGVVAAGVGVVEELMLPENPSS